MVVVLVSINNTVLTSIDICERNRPNVNLLYTWNPTPIYPPPPPTFTTTCLVGIWAHNAAQRLTRSSHLCPGSGREQNTVWEDASWQWATSVQMFWSFSLWVCLPPAPSLSHSAPTPRPTGGGQQVPGQHFLQSLCLLPR